MTKKEIENIRGKMRKPQGRKTLYGFKDLKIGETKRITMANGDEKTNTLNSLRARCSQENKSEQENNPDNPKFFVAWCDAVGVYYKREK